MAIFLVFIATAHGFTINCVYEDLNWGGILPSEYTCTGTVSASDNNTSVLTVTGTHLTGRTNADVRGFSIYNSQITNRLPSNINSFFPNIVAVDWVFGTLSTINSEDLRQFPNLIMLSVFGNQLTLLDSNLFTHTRSLRWVELSNNRITNIGEGILANLTDLQFVLFERNTCYSTIATTPESIAEIQEAFITECPASLTVDCVYGDVNWSGIMPTVYTCTGTVSGTGSFVLNVRGTHLAGRTDADVAGVSIYNSQVSRQLPRNFNNFFPNVQAFDYVFGTLSAISANDLRQFPDLRMLSLFGNDIALIDGNLFSNTPNINWIELSNNRITNVGEGAFANLTNLNFVLFQRNACYDVLATTPESINELHETMRSECPATRTIDCVYEDLNWYGIETSVYTCTGTISGTGNSVLNIRGTHLPGRTDNDVAGVSIYNAATPSRIPININSFFPNVRAFDWVFGSLSSISANDLRQFPGLTMLSVFGNAIRSLDANTFVNNPRLRWIDLSNNRITNIGESAFAILYELRWLLFQRNTCYDTLATTPEAIWEFNDAVVYMCPAQLTVDCVYEELNWAGVIRSYTCSGTVTGTGNRVLNIRGVHLPGRSNLDVTGVSIYNSQLTNRIPGNFDNFFPTVQAVDWVFGDLTQLSANDLRQFPGLQWLSVFGNRLTSLDTTLFASTPNIRWVDLSNNQIANVGEGVFDTSYVLQWVLLERNPCINVLATTPESIWELREMLPFECPAQLTIDCVYEEISWAGVLRAYTCTGNVTGTGNQILNVRGNHLPGRSIMDVTGVSIYNAELTTTAFPTNFNNHFVDVQALDWVFGSLSSIAAYDLEQFPGLLWLSVFGNQISHLEGDLFRHTPLIRWVDLGNNLISHVGAGIFSETYFIQWVLFQRNPCLDFIATTPESLSVFFEELLYACPAYDGGETCPAACAVRIDDLESRVRYLEAVIESIQSHLVSSTKNRL